MKTTKLAATALAALLSMSAAAAPLELSNNYVKAGVSDYGTLGSNHSTSPGILYDPTGTSNYGNNDFLTPGTPFEGFYITSGQANWHSNNTGSRSGFPASWSLTSHSATQADAEATTTDGMLKVLHEYALSTSGGVVNIRIKTTLTNESGSDLTDLKFLRTLDPDPDVNNHGVFATINQVVSTSRACGSGANTDQTICIDTAGSPYTHRAGVSRPWSTSPSVYLAGVDDGDGDWAIGLAFDIGTLSAGGSAVLRYSYILAEDSAPVTSIAPVPTLETWGLGLLGGAFVLLAAARRRKDKKAAEDL